MEKSSFDELKRKFKTNELYNLYLETGEDFDKVARSMSRAGQLDIEEAKEFLQAVIDEHELDSIKSVMIEEEPQVNAKKNKKGKNKKPNKLKAFWNKGKLQKVVVVVVVLLLISGLGQALSNGEEKVTTKTDEETTVNSSSEGQNTQKEETKKEDDVPTEYKSALRQAKSYSDNLYMSKQGIYDQLVSEYGGQFSAEAAQYAIDNLEADYKKNALEQAKSYQETLAMSPNAIYDQLISEYGGQFTAEEAQYAIDNLE